MFIAVTSTAKAAFREARPAPAKPSDQGTIHRMPNDIPTCCSTDASPRRARVLLCGYDRRPLLQRLYKWQRGQRLALGQLEIIFVLPNEALPTLGNSTVASGKAFQLIVCQLSEQENFSEWLAHSVALADEALFLKTTAAPALAASADNVTAWPSARAAARTDRLPARNRRSQKWAHRHPG
ncbi:hypothetical protein LMG33810_000520 [Carnimonas sp. LMG 33810]